MEKQSVAGVLFDAGARKCLIAQRKSGGALGNKWEFPGGKVEAGESEQAALVREYQEELGVPVTVGDFLGETWFEYRGPRRLRAYRVYAASCDFTLREHTQWRWAGLADLAALDFADSDRALFPCLEPYFNG
ncbi:MAG: (deoxy)nucleoside triphosphate pyrophosphohydrolase [Spirochaetaceae bacterium]|jgi:8-oxo-dGTP diphosphatase|nr:(deoxy)nucleoside triphosphate pyrophosphohydrolase [Spirochaetaceae bacterium]